MPTPKKDVVILREDVDIENAIQKAMNDLLGIRDRSPADRHDILDTTALSLAEAMCHHIINETEAEAAKAPSKTPAKPKPSSKKTSTMTPTTPIAPKSTRKTPKSTPKTPRPALKTPQSTTNTPRSTARTPSPAPAPAPAPAPKTRLKSKPQPTTATPKPRTPKTPVPPASGTRSTPASSAPPRKRPRSPAVVEMSSPAAAAAGDDSAVPAKKRRRVFHEVVRSDDDDAEAEAAIALDSASAAVRAAQAFAAAVWEGSVGEGETSAAPRSSRNDRFVEADVMWWRGGGGSPSAALSPLSQAALRGKMREFVVAITWACVSEKWSAEELVWRHETDAASRAGALYQDVSFVLTEIERARSATVEKLDWSAELVETLETKSVLAWKAIEYDPTFEQFAGCDVCCQFSSASRLLWAGGSSYSALTYWPKACTFQVASVESLPSGSTRVACSVQDSGDTPNLAPWPAAKSSEKNVIALDTLDPNTAELWVDELCIQRCMLYHEMSHVVARVSDLVRQQIASVLAGGCVELPSLAVDSGGGDKLIMSRLHTFIADSILGNKSFMDQTVDWVLEIYVLGMSGLDEKSMEGRVDIEKSECKLALNDQQKGFLQNVVAQLQS